MPRKQLNIGLTPEQRAEVDEIATALDTTPTEFARSTILEAVQLQRALTAKIGQNQGFSGILAGSPCRISPGEALKSRRTKTPRTFSLANRKGDSPLQSIGPITSIAPHG